MRVTLDELLRRSNNMMTGVHTNVRLRMVEVIKTAYAEGINVQVSSGFRSDIDQAFIYGQGRHNFVYKGKQYGRPYDANGKKLYIVSNAKPFSSIHNYGLAVDYFLTTHDGKKAVWVVNDQWRRVAAIAKAYGFTWGGDWKSFPDNPHLEYTRGLSLKQIQEGKVPTFIPLATPAHVKTAFTPPVPSKPHRLFTGTFRNDSDVTSARLRLYDKYAMAIYPRPDLRLMTGVFTSKEKAEEAANNIRKDFGWVVYVKEA